VHFEKRGANGVRSRIAMVGRGWAPRSALLVHWGEERIYAFRSQMAKVEQKRSSAKFAFGEFCELRNDGVLRSSHLALVGGIMLSRLPILSCLERGGRYLCPATSKTRQGSSRLRP
jgi:hypothetical protein